MPNGASACFGKAEKAQFARGDHDYPSPIAGSLPSDFRRLFRYHPKKRGKWSNFQAARMERLPVLVFFQKE